MEGRQQECQKLSNDLLVTQEHNNKLKEELHKSKDHLKSTQQQHDILAKDLITKLECEEEKQTYLENKIQLLTDQNKTLQRMLEETPVEKLKPDFDQTSENKVLLESLKNERASKQNVQSTLQETLDTLESLTNEKDDLVSELAVKQLSMQEALKRLETLAEEKRNLENELTAERKSNQESQDQIKDLSAQLSQVTDKCDEEVIVSEDLQQQLDDVTSELKHAMRVKTRLQNSLNDMAPLHDKEKGELEARISKLEKELEENKSNKVNEVISFSQNGIYLFFRTKHVGGLFSVYYDNSSVAE